MPVINGFEELFREAFSRLPTGVVVLTGALEGRPYGLTCQAFSSLSLIPPLAVFAISTASKSWPYIEQGKVYGANVLASDQHDVARRFAKSGGDKFEGIAFEWSKDGAPLLEGVAAFVGGSIEEVREAGDHYLVVGSVSQALSFGRDPLIYYHRGFWEIGKHLGPLHPLS